MNPLSHEDAVLLETLRNAGREALERKRRLGQYAVVWRDGHPAFIGTNPPTQTAGDRGHAPKSHPGVADSGTRYE